MVITKRARLLAPPFVGTRIRIRVDDPLDFMIKTATLADGSDRIVVDWGDGLTDVYNASLVDVRHPYSKPGEYTVKISDDIAKVGIGYKTPATVYSAIYAPMVIGFESNASKLTTLPAFAFHNALNLSSLNVSNSGLNSLTNAAFKGCSTLAGALYFPKVTSIAGTTATTLPFCECLGIAELHFGEQNKGVIMELPSWELSGGKFGAENATVFFDL